MSDRVSRRELLRASAAGLGAGAIALPGLATPHFGSLAARQITESKLYEVLDRGTVVVGTGSTNPPWHFEDASGNLIGFDIEMARILAKGLFDDAQKVEFVREASDARIPNLVTGQVDVVFQFMTVNANRAQQVEFTIPYYREGVGT